MDTKEFLAKAWHNWICKRLVDVNTFPEQRWVLASACCFDPCVAIL